MTATVSFHFPCKARTDPGFVELKIFSFKQHYKKITKVWESRICFCFSVFFGSRSIPPIIFALNFACGPQEEGPSRALPLPYLRPRRCCFFAGGGPGARGLNLLIRTDGRTINLGPKTAVPIQPGVSMTNRFVYRGQVFVDGREGTATKMDRVDRKRSGSAAAAAALFFVRLLLLLA